MTLGGAFDEVMAGARAGASWAWTQLYRDLAPVVLGYLRTRGAAESDDLTGEVFLQVVRNLPRFKGGERDFRAWVLTIAHRRLVDERRRRGRAPVEPTTTATLESRGERGDSEAEALEALTDAATRRLLGRLTEDQQDVMLLRIIAGLTIEEVARVVGKRPGAVKALQRRAVAALRQEISPTDVPL